MRITLIALLMAGCSGEFTADQFNKATVLCQPNGGVKSVIVQLNYMNVNCNNGARFLGVN
jgi:hypothetical protein